MFLPVDTVGDIADKVEVFISRNNSSTKLKVTKQAHRAPRQQVHKSRQHYADWITEELQTSLSINISTKTVGRELRGLGFQAWAAPVDVMCRWPSTFPHVVC